MKYKFHPLAIKELENSINYYKNISLTLGLEFLEEFHSCIRRILKFPLAWTKLTITCRRCILNRFPYGIIYTIDDDLIIIVAVMQLNKKPNYWENRQ